MTVEYSFDAFIAKEIIEANASGNGAIRLSFRQGGLNVECPWRILDSDGKVAAGYSDFLTDDSRLHAGRVRRLLEGNVISDIRIDAPADLTVGFRDGSRLDLFHDSHVYEGWQLSGDDGSCLVSLPGGDYTGFE